MIEEIEIADLLPIGAPDLMKLCAVK